MEVMDGGPQDPWGTDGTSLPSPSHAPRTLRSPNCVTHKKRTAARIGSGGDKKAERTDRLMERTKSGYDHDRAPPPPPPLGQNSLTTTTIAKEGKGNFFPSPKPKRYKVVRFLWLSRRLNYSGMSRPLRLLFLLTDSASV